MSLFPFETDVAALVYRPGDDPDALLAGFARARLGEGHDVLGLLQRRVIPDPFDPDTSGTSGFRPDRPAPDRRTGGKVTFHLVPGFEWGDVEAVSLPSHRASAHLGHLGRALADRLPRRPDLVLVGRYGRAETRGEGLLDLLSTLADSGIPTLIGVPEALFPHWTQTTGGMTVRLSASLESLDDWWRSLGMAPRRQISRPATCCHAPH